MELKPATREQVAMAYERDMKRAFPPAELKPLKNILAMREAGRYRTWCLFDGEEIAGECFLWLGHPGWALLDYLCVSESRRNSGAGALILSELRRVEGNAVVFGESEAPEHAPDPAMAERRLGFYARCGCRAAGYDTELFGVHYKTLYLADRAVPDETLLREHLYIYESTFPREKLERFVRIPRDPAAEPAAKVPWNED